MGSKYRDGLNGAAATVATIPANFPFGLIVGVSAVNLGISVFEITAMSALTFAGASQIAVIELLRTEAQFGVLLLTAALINVRYVMYSASIATYVDRLSRPWRWVVGFFLIDITYAVAVSAYEDPSVSRGWYYLGAALPVWLSWIAGTFVGAIVGTSIPPGWNLQFTIPLLFLAFLVPTLENKPSVGAAIVGGLVATAGSSAPFNLGLIGGGICGVVAGVLIEFAQRRGMIR